MSASEDKLICWREETDGRPMIDIIDAHSNDEQAPGQKEDISLTIDNIQVKRFAFMDCFTTTCAGAFLTATGDYGRLDYTVVTFGLNQTKDRIEIVGEPFRLKNVIGPNDLTTNPGVL